MATKLLQCNSHRDYFDRWEKISARIHHDTGNHMGVAWVQSGGLTRKSRGLMETARARTSTSRGFRSGTGTPCLISITSGPPKRGTTTARQVFSAAAVDATRRDDGEPLPPSTTSRWNTPNSSGCACDSRAGVGGGNADAARVETGLGGEEARESVRRG
jgi:hypothetical protein